MFKLDSPLMNFLNKVADVMILDVLVLLGCLPIITAGASITAGYYIAYKMVKDEETYIVKGFWKSFKENFKQSTILWIIMMIIGGILYYDFKLMSVPETGVQNWMSVAVFTVSVVLAMSASFVFPMQARFTNTVKNTLKNAFLMALSHLPTALISTVAITIPFVMTYFVPQAIPAIALLAFGGLIYFKSKLFLRAFKKYEDIMIERQREAGELVEAENEDSGIFAGSEALEKMSENEEKNK